MHAAKCRWGPGRWKCPRLYRHRQRAQTQNSLARTYPNKQIITFDPHGISSHPNHRSLSTYRPPTLSLTRLYHLRTPLSVLTKYSGPLNPLFRRAWYQLSVGLSEWAEVFDMPQSVGDDVTLINSGLDWVRSVRAMLRHKSQMRWFRYGWVAGSGVMWANDLRFVA